MKDNLTANKKINTSKSPSNLFLNIVIILLAAIIIFMAYSLFVKLQNAWSSDTAAENKSTSVIQVEVLNGCGTSGIAEKFTRFLRENNFDVVQTGNYFSFNIENSMIVDRTGNISNAYKVAEALGIDKKHVIQQKNNDYFLDVSLIIGKDYIQLSKVN